MSSVNNINIIKDKLNEQNKFQQKFAFDKFNDKSDVNLIISRFENECQKNAIQ